MIPVTVTFYGDVGFDRSYNHVIDFSDETERENYFSPKTLRTIQNCAYNKPMNSIQVKCPYEEALNFTYCKFIIGSNANSQKKIYAWVDDVILITDQIDETNTFIPILQINISVDPWQTFLFNFTLGESFVAREHVDRYKNNTGGTKGWCLPNTSDDASVGSEFRQTSLTSLRHSYNLKTINSQGATVVVKLYWVLIQYIPTGYAYFKTILVPFCKTQNERIYIKYNDTTVKFTQGLSFLYDGEFLKILGITPDTVASAYLIPFDICTTTEYYIDGKYCYELDLSEHINYYYKELFSDPSAQNPSQYVGFVVSNNIDKPYISASINLNLNVPRPPQDGNLYSPQNNFEPQLFKRPYRRLAYINENNVEAGALPDICANIAFNAIDIKVFLDAIDVKMRMEPSYQGIRLDNKYWFEVPLTKIDVFRNNWLTYFLESRETDRQMLQSQVNQQAIASAVGGLSGATSLGGQGAISAGAKGGDVFKGGITGAAVGLGVGAVSTVGGYIADKHFAFEQQDIREKAIRRKSNNIIQSGNFRSIINDGYFCFVKCDETTLSLKALEFHKYGYSVFYYETPNLKSRKYFNFIATNIVKIEGSLNNQIKMALSDIFNNGVTIWHGDYINELTGIGDYSKENIERSLL